MRAVMISQEQNATSHRDVETARRRRRALEPTDDTADAGDAPKGSLTGSAGMTEFLAMLSHELRTPITIIGGNGHLLRRDLSALPELERRQALDDICDEAERLRALVEDLMILGNASSPEYLDGQLEPVYVGPIAEQVIRRHRRHEPDRSIRLEIAPCAAPALGIPGFIEQILDNFITNAVKYSANDRAVVVVVAATVATIDVHVLDRGLGIQPGEENDVFTPFFRSDRAARMASGSGIGLAVCRRLADAQGGRVWARSRHGGGSEFALALRRTT